MWVAGWKEWPCRRRADKALFMVAPDRPRPPRKQEITISDAQTLVSELDTVAASIRSEIDEWKAKIASISAQNDSLFDEITKLKNQREKAFAEVDEAERLAMKKDLRLEEYGEWWVGALS